MVSGRHGVAGIQQAVAKRSSVEVARFFRVISMACRHQRLGAVGQT
jgi:hypothetical protein